VTVVTGSAASPLVVKVEPQLDWNQSVSIVTEVDGLDWRRVRSTTQSTSYVRPQWVHDSINC